MLCCMESHAVNDDAPRHYRIYIYMNAGPPLGEPTAVSLCPYRRGRNGELTGDVDAVTCAFCIWHIHKLGIAQFLDTPK